MMRARAFYARASRARAPLDFRTRRRGRWNRRRGGTGGRRGRGPRTRRAPRRGRGRGVRWRAKPRRPPTRARSRLSPRRPMTTPRTNPTPLRPPPWRLSPIAEPEPARSSPSAAAAAVDPCLTSPPPPPSPNLKPSPSPNPQRRPPRHPRPRPARVRFSPSVASGRVRISRPARARFAKPAAHRLQTSLHSAHRDHHEDEAAIEAARASRTKLPSHAYAKHVHPACQDESYWAQYVSFVLG